MSTPDRAARLALPGLLEAIGVSKSGPPRLRVAIVLTALTGLAGAQPISPLPPPIFADGSGLPAGGARAADGERLYRERCAECHGQRGEGASALELVGDPRLNASDYPDRGIAAFWPYAPPLFDYVRRAMPPDAPWSLDADQTYAIVGWLLVLNGLAEPEQSVNAVYLGALRLPNASGFRPADDGLVPRSRR